MTNTMKAFQIHTFGGREVLELNDIAIPEAKQGEVLIKIHAATFYVLAFYL